VTQLTKPSRRGPCIIFMGTLSCLESRMSTCRQCDLCVPSHVTHGVICFSPPPRLLYFAVQIRKHLLYHLNLSNSIPHESPNFDAWLRVGSIELGSQPDEAPLQVQRESHIYTIENQCNWGEASSKFKAFERKGVAHSASPVR